MLIGVAYVRVIDLDQGHRRPAPLRLFHAEAEQIISGNPVVDRLAVRHGTRVHLPHGTHQAFRAQQSECGFGKGQRRIGIDNPAEHFLLNRIIDGTEANAFLAAQRSFGVNGNGEL